MDIKKAKQFIISNARPLELAWYRAVFEGGPKGAVVEELKKFQNPDGGFGNALEPDNWNPNSTPITTNDAIIHLYQCGALVEAGNIIEGIARWLKSGDGFDRGQQRWRFAVESSKEHPHAIWWEPGDGKESWNPTVSLAAFLVCMGGGEPWRGLVREAFRWLETVDEADSHEVQCFMLAHRMMELYGVTDVIDLDKAREAVKRAVGLAVCHEVEKYGVEYVAGPSAFFHEESPYVPEGIEDLVKADLAAIDKLQMEDGGFDITWQWHTPYEQEYKQARDWWRPRVTLEKLGFYLAFNGGESK
ncbi:hypothetical protein [Acutalibacter muris]|uniref:hypothetical protein n=1 Tax=Acutalibacter muris TaxID=1796620 RepID=UPI00272ED947|nr:hypothetical protein [Acutalibacter muris]